MHSAAARIALLAYLIGGMAVPAIHRHDGGTASGESAAQTHSGCVLEGHVHLPAAADIHAQRPETEGHSNATLADASSERTAACSDNCVICVFAGSPQSSAPEGAISLSSHPVVHITPGHVGPGFEAADGEPNRLRGPPVSMILG